MTSVSLQPVPILHHPEHIFYEERNDFLKYIERAN
jgi:hypothetical protein